MNQDKNTPTEEISEIDEILENISAHIKEQELHTELAASLARLKKNSDFQMIIEEIFIENGRELLWENIKAYEESDLLDKGSAKAENVGRFKTEVQARLILKRFLDTITSDAEEAEESIKEAIEYREQVLNSKTQGEA